MFSKLKRSIGKRCGACLVNVEMGAWRVCGFKAKDRQTNGRGRRYRRLRV